MLLQHLQQSDREPLVEAFRCLRAGVFWRLAEKHPISVRAGKQSASNERTRCCLPFTKTQILAVEEQLPPLFTTYADDGVLAEVVGEVSGRRLGDGFIPPGPAGGEEADVADDGAVG